MAYSAFDVFGNGYRTANDLLQLLGLLLQPEQVFKGSAVVKPAVHKFHHLIIVYADLAALADQLCIRGAAPYQFGIGGRYDTERSAENAGADKSGFVWTARLFVHGEEPHVFFVGQPDIIDICSGVFGGFSTALFCIHHSTVLKI